MYGLYYFSFLVCVIISKIIKVLHSCEFSHFPKHYICLIRYIATVDGLVHKRHLTAISEGTTIEGVHCVPDSVELLPRMPDTQRSRLRIVVNISIFDLLYQLCHPTLVVNF